MHRSLSGCRAIVICVPYLGLGGLVVAIIATMGIANASAPDTASSDFYGATAQVLPVLLVVLAFEIRLFRLPNVKKLWSYARRTGDAHDYALGTFMATVVLSVALLYLVAGEFQALAALAAKHPQNEDPSIVYQAVAVGLVAISYVALFYGPRHPDDHLNLE